MLFRSAITDRPEQQAGTCEPCFCEREECPFFCCLLRSISQLPNATRTGHEQGGVTVQQIEDTRFEFEPAPSPPPRTTPTSSPEPAMDAVTTDPRKPQPPQPEAPSAAVEQVPEAPVEAAAALSINPSASSAAAPEDIELLPPAESDPAAVTEEPAADPSASMEVDPTEAEVKSEPVDVVVDEIPAAAVSTPSETLAMDAAIAATLATLGTVVDSKPAADALTAVAESGPGARAKDATNATSTPLYPYSEASTPNGTPGPSAAPAPRPSRFSDATPSSIEIGRASCRERGS